MEASVVSIPIMFIFGFGSLFEELAASKNISFLIDYLPNMQLINIARMDEAGTTLMQTMPHILTITAWLVAAVIATIFVYKKKELD